ncbi:MAG: prenyltransferase/squalene oxidase repeat-containing protein [Patescibacteria group bacterium]|nr:prenyltransferase/squalene oxidase repeat-containing protein [Patescibacteria group bacterium]
MPQCAHDSTDSSQPLEAVTGIAPDRGTADRRPARVIELPPPPVLVGNRVRIESCEDAPARAGWRAWCSARVLASFLTSFLFHFGLLLGLALWVSRGEVGTGGITLWVTPSDDQPLIFSDSVIQQAPSPERDRFSGDAVVVEHGFDGPQIRGPETERLTAAQPRQPESTFPHHAADYFLKTDGDVSGALAGRGRQARAELAQIGGATPGSEEAVERGLRWLMTQQRNDGSFSFRQLRNGCGNPGTEGSTTAATAMCILPYLGAGYTHVDGPYQEVVRRGTYYLLQNARQTEHGADLQNGTMYGQGLATIALCEAYAMTRDPAFRGLAEQAIRFIVFAQNQQVGGWRYTPGQPGDTTVTGWQLMALKSGQMAGLQVPSPTLVMVHRFLDRVQSEYGAKYGYLDPQPRDTTTAIGLLCRMYTGWPREYEPLQRGVAYLDSLGPSKDNMYFNYYATQVIHHYGAEPWQRWNPVMRDYLVATQSAQGAEAGSWHFPDRHGDAGGRLYNTAMAIMTLEVYYRYMPLYGERAVTEAF